MGRPDSGLSATSLAQVVATGMDPVCVQDSWPIQKEYGVDESRRRADCPHAGTYPASCICHRARLSILLLAGDTSYNQQLLLDETCDGVSPNPAVTLETLRRIRRLAEGEPLVYLPSHDPEGAERLARESLLHDLTAATARR